MKKRVNKVALALWILAGISLIADLAMQASFLQAIEEQAKSGIRTYQVFGAAWSQFRGALGTVAILVALGTVIELLDRIWWTLRSGRNEPFR